MFWAINDFIRDFYKTRGPFKNLLDVGSRDINGSVKAVIEYERFTMPEEIIGIDMVEGKNVDVVMNGHDLLKRYQKESFDCVTCCETLEHDNKFWLTVDNMRLLVKPGGWMLITVPGLYFFRHDYPDDYYRFTDSVFYQIFFEGWEDVVVRNYEDQADTTSGKPNQSVMGYGRKPL